MPKDNAPVTFARLSEALGGLPDEFVLPVPPGESTPPQVERRYSVAFDLPIAAWRLATLGSPPAWSAYASIPDGIIPITEQLLQQWITMANPKRTRDQVDEEIAALKAERKTLPPNDFSDLSAVFGGEWVAVGGPFWDMVGLPAGIEVFFSEFSCNLSVTVGGTTRSKQIAHVMNGGAVFRWMLAYVLQEERSRMEDAVDNLRVNSLRPETP